MEYLDYPGGADFADGSEGSAERNMQLSLNQPTTSSGMDRPKAAFYNPTVAQISCDIKPRLTKEQHDILETHYMKQNKPNTNTKKGFAESLGVSLDKVNNWFQNRRAKSKQDAKKAVGALNLFHQQQSNGQLNFGSDSDTSPSFASPEYYTMMQRWSADDQAHSGLGTSPMQQPQEQGHMHGLPFHNDASNTQHYQNYNMPQQMHNDMFDSPDDMNRRTLTQDQFDAIARNGGMMNSSGAFDGFQTHFSGNQDVMSQVFPGLDLKQQDVFAFPHPVGAPLSSNDSTVPSTSSDGSMPAFPSSSSMQNQAYFSASSSEWGDSRSSSIAGTQPEALHHQPAMTTSQWQPGQSVPVDFNALNQEFRQAALAAQARQSPLQPQSQEQPLAWPADEAFGRRDSQTNLLAQSMSNVGICTPQPYQSATFKSPTPSMGLAARRQKHRPTNLTLNGTRSQSYSGVPQASPSQVPHQQSLTPGQPLRRIRSGLANGSVAQGRVMKSMPGSAQRSPLSWSFADAMNSPQVAYHAPVQTPSHGSLAPPTPMTPSEFPRQEQSRQYPSWQTQTSSTHISRQPSITETDVEHGMPYHPAASVPMEFSSSPPHTPMYYPQQYVQHRVGNNVITENTPPQSAPAAQQYFPASLYSTQPQPQSQPPQLPAETQAQQQAQTMAMSQPKQFMNVIVPDPQPQMPNVTFAPTQQINMTSGAPPSMPVQFANGVPQVTADGNFHMTFPSQPHFPSQPPRPQSQPHMHTPPQVAYPVMSSSGAAPSMQMTSPMVKQAPQPAPDFVAHEYRPPHDANRSVTPHKAVDVGVKNYTFANAHPVDFEEKMARKAADSKANSTSP